MEYNLMRTLCVVMAAALGAVTVQATEQKSNRISKEGSRPTYMQANAPIEERVKDLLARMTLEEKTAQLQSSSPIPQIPSMPIGPTSSFGIFKDGKVNDAVAQRALGNGIGVYTNLSFAGTAISAVAGVQQQNAIQQWVMTNTRLKIPVMFRAEALHGAVVTGATSFPQAVGLGSTWDRELIREMFEVVGREARAGGMSAVLAPVFDLARDPRFGRVEEMYSEDPYLVGELGVAAVQGLQGIDSDRSAIDRNHVMATAKHFVHGQPESGTNTAPNDFSERTMRSIFFLPFEKAVKIGKVGAVMPSYNENDGGIPSHANRWMLKDVLRGEWGFNGIVDSDWFAVSQLARSHHVAKDLPAAGVLAFNSGTDIESPTSASFATLKDAISAGSVREEDINVAVSRVLTMKFRLGLFEHPYTDPKRPAAEVGAPANNALARKVDDESIILLKNADKLLPIDAAKIGSIAVIGPNANKVRIGGYSAMPPYFASVLDGIRERVSIECS
ncbi:glycoside hydrolase family 3 protein [Sphingobium sp. AP50]|uniref:glycoside hydrolase family 3 protein n=1 Tax=Sphingobium sp. AP50 TaxID=1884369 RepID=UPI0015A60C28|nr:glycoside hydrolase family 3 protein [Sphingobium sp. AP50]